MLHYVRKMFLINDPVQEQDIAKPKPNHTRKVSMEYITIPESNGKQGNTQAQY